MRGVWGGGSLRTKTLILTAFVSNAVGGVGYKLATVRDLMPFPRGRRQGAEPLQLIPISCRKHVSFKNAQVEKQ